MSMFSFTIGHTDDMQALLDLQTETLVEEQVLSFKLNVVYKYFKTIWIGCAITEC